MNTEQIRRIESIMDRALSAMEKERLGRMQTTLGVADNDALWEVLAALEYQRTFYDELPQKIGATATEILQGITTAAEKEAAAAQARLTDCVVQQAQRLSAKIHYATLLPMGLAALVCLLAYGSLLLWAGFCIGSGQAQPLALWLRMPSGVLMAGLCLATGLFLGVYAGREFAEGGKGWWQRMLVALVMLATGGILTGLGL
jgi:hypothetical protein